MSRIELPMNTKMREPYIVNTVDRSLVVMKPYYMKLNEFKRNMVIKYGKCTVKKVRS